MLVQTIAQLVSVLVVGTLILFAVHRTISNPVSRKISAWLLVAGFLLIGWWIARPLNAYLRLVTTWIAMFLAFKSLRILSTSASDLNNFTFRRYLGFMLWLGMDFPAWLQPDAPVSLASRRFREGIILAIAGFSLMLVMLFLPLDQQFWLVRASLAWVGSVLAMFFGITRVWMSLWNYAGRDLALLFDRPLYAKTVSEWWGKRWNMAVHTVLAQAIFQPLRKKLDLQSASIGVFLASGAMHEYLLSYPARGGYGLPTLYFVVQALAMRIEQNRRFRQWLRAKWWRSSVWTLGATLIPAPLLFHPVLLRAVVVPLFRL